MTPSDTDILEHLRWLDWDTDAFAQAAREDKLVLLDIGATWCHWCHVMDRVTYEDPEVIELLNERFVSIRVDRDRLPHVDVAMQRAIPAIQSQGGGWPLTVVLTPEGYVLYKATFVPPRAGPPYGASMGLIDLLNRIDLMWRQQRGELTQVAAEVDRRTALQDDQLYQRPGELAPETIDALVAAIRREIDPTHGGSGGAPKFFQTPALELLARAAWTSDDAAEADLLATLDAIVRGGVHDHVGGGFHRYSVDERWHVPHFEKMAYDNAPLLSLLANACANTGREDFARVIGSALAWIRRDLTDPTGAFYASQDADVGLDDDGDYFTWTVDEVRGALGDDADVTLSYYGVDDAGDMHGRPGRNVLHTPKTIDQEAGLLGVGAGQLTKQIVSATERLLAVRETRTRPGIDQTIFADLNGMLIDAHLTVSDRLGDVEAERTAIRALDAILAELQTDGGAFAHYRQDGDLHGVGLLVDQAWMLRALIHAYSITLDDRYLQAARQAADFILAELTAGDGAFLSAPAAGDGPTDIEPQRSWQDAPTRSAASVTAEELIRLAYLTDDDRYAAAAQRALASFGGIDETWGAFAAGYAAALETHLNGPRTILVLGPAGDEATGALADAARRAYLPGGLVLQLDPAQPDHRTLLDRLGYAPGDRPVAYVCRGRLCLAPAETPAELRERLVELARGP